MLQLSSDHLCQSNLLAGRWIAKVLAHQPSEVRDEVTRPIEGGHNLTHLSGNLYRIKSQRPFQRVREIFSRQVRRLNDSGEAVRCEHFCTDRLFAFVCSAWHDNQRSPSGERLPHAVVAAHADNCVRGPNELEIVCDRQHCAPRRTSREEQGSLFLGHKRSCHENRANIRKLRAQAREGRLGGLEDEIPVPPSTDCCDNKASIERQFVSETNFLTTGLFPLSDDIPTIVKLQLCRLWNQVGLCDIEEIA